jgi:hypothetical protein
VCWGGDTLKDIEWTTKIVYRITLIIHNFFKYYLLGTVQTLSSLVIIKDRKSLVS